jgi:hypothetical protein
MKIALAATLLLLAARAPAAAQDGAPTVETAAETDPGILAITEKLKNDPAFLDAVAARIARSRLVGRLTTDASPEARQAAAKEWVAADPSAAAHVALGLTADDVDGTTNYEDVLLGQLGKAYGNNPGAEKNLFGRLRKSAHDSKLLKKQSDEMSEDEKHEILRSLFEGEGNETNKVLTMKDDGKAPSAGPAAGPATAFNGIYNRLSAGNLHGYSPQLLALQNALSARRPPGAPALLETGKLDEATLGYPAYGMSYDLDNLDKRSRQDRILALARLSGKTLTARDWKDPDLEAKLKALVPADKLPSRLKRRAELSAKARAALAAFSAAAAKARNPDAVTRGLLIELGGKQKETARWITAAALEEELSRLEPLESFLTPELLAVIDAAPVVAPEREAYKKRGAALQSRLASLKANAEKAQGLLLSDGWAGSLAAVDALVAQNQNIKWNLGRDIDDFSRVPYRIAESRVSQPRWRVWADNLAVKWAPTLDYSRGVARRRGRLSRFLSVFGLIASGDSNGAHSALVNETGGR